MKARLLRTMLEDPYANVALEEALFGEIGGAVVRLWENQESVVLGAGQLAAHETDMAYCEAEGIPVVRRMSAGGAVYNGPGNLNWSFFVRRGDGPVGRGEGPRRVFEAFAGVVARALEGCGVEAEFRPPNSLATVDGKVSGMAAYVSREAVLCHGTLLMSADLELVRRLTRPSEAKLERRYPRSNFVEVANCGAGAGQFAERLGVLEPRVPPTKPRSLERRMLGAGVAPTSGC